MKSTSKIYLKFVALGCIVTHMLILLQTPVLALSENAENVEIGITDNEQSEGAAELMSNTSGVSSSNLTFSITKPSVSLPGSTCVAFDSTDVIDYSFNSEGMTVVENQSIPMKFDLITNDEFGMFEITAEKADGNIYNKTLYTYRNANDVFVSDVSKDSAWHSAKLDDFNNELITTEEWHEQYSSYSLSLSEEASNISLENSIDVIEAVADGNIVVRGKMTWMTDSNNELPLRSTKVELREKELFDSEPIATTYTDEDGYYCFVIDPDEWEISSDFILKLFVRIYIESFTTKIVFPFWASFNYLDSDVVTAFASDAREININRKILNDEKNIPYRLIYIQQGMVVGERFATEMGMETDEMLYAFYIGDISVIPYEITGMSQTDFKDLVETVNGNAFCYDTISFIGHSHYNNFATTIHEYGHFVENRMGNYGSAIKGHLFESIPAAFRGEFENLTEFINDFLQNIDDYTHYVHENHFSDANTTKAFQTELTWTESWASAFAEIAFTYYGNQYSSSVYSESTNYEINTDSNGNTHIYDGEAQEYAVTSFLWDLYDNSSTETDDNISMEEQDWWDITTKSGICTIQDFSENIFENHPELISGIGELMSKHKISPELMYVSYNSDQTAPPYIRLKVNGGVSYPNNKLCIAFYDDNELLTTTSQVSIVRGSSEEFFYYVSTNDWNNVLALSDFNTTIYAVIYGYRTDGDITSGPYFSKAVLVYDVYSHHKDHIKGYTSITSSSHTLLCDCGFSVTSNHHAYRYSHIPNNTSSHRAYCECGKEWTEPHVIESGSYTGVNKYAICLCCRALVTVGMTIHPTTSDLLRTENGSYILPNGVIVLVREDIEAYFAGTLEFIYPDGNLETE